ncbi:MAG: 4-hydroxy-3-methylbut-2-enyl diphosphate reductase [Pseudomonadota bacterium]
MNGINKKIIVAKSAGFCWGVSRAFEKVLKIVENNSEGKPVFTYGPLIHNPQAVSLLEEKGVQVLQEIPEKLNGTIVIRTHGIPPEDRRKIESSGAIVCDATCPDVGIIQGKVRKHLKQGYYIIIIGDREHPEVKALLGFAERKGTCINSAKEVGELPIHASKVCVVSQSTQQYNKFEELVNLIKQKYPQAVVYDTICRSTGLRQEEVRELAKEVDAMVVVGGRNSSNTNRLAEIAREMGSHTFFIENDSELTPENFRDFDTIGVTAGASTPKWVIEQVVTRLKQLLE